MKFRSYFVLFMALSLAALTSCKKESYIGRQATANFEAPVFENDGEKLYYTGSAFVWKSTDKIGVWDHSLQYQEYRAVPYDASGNVDYNHDINMTLATDQPADAVTALDENSTYYAFYPTFLVPARTSQYMRSTGASTDPVFTVELKPQQILDNTENTEERLARLQLTRFPMVCKTTSSAFPFKSLCGILRIDLGVRNMKIKSIKFESIQGKQVSGLFDVSWDGNTNPVLTEKESSDPTKHSVTLTHYNPVDLNTQVDGHNRYFYIYLPPNTYTGFKLTLVDDQGRSCTKSWKNTTIPITRNRIQPISFASVNFNLTQKSGVFTTELDCQGNNYAQVYFSTGNLQYVNTNWQFASQQYELLHNGTYDPDQFGSAGHEWDMFRWSIAGSDYGKTADANYSSVDSDQDFVDYGQVFGANSPWRTLSGPEWFVVLHARHTQFIVDGQEVRFLPVAIRTSEVMNHSWGGNPYAYHVLGILLVPDNYTLAKWQALGLSTPTVINATTTTDNEPWEWNLNGNGWTVCDKAKFAQMEKDGLIFLPFTKHVSNDVTQHFEQADYWSSSQYSAAIDQGNSEGTGGTAMNVFMQSVAGSDVSGILYHGNGNCNLPCTWKDCVYVQNGQGANGWAAVRLVRDAQ
jgi:hypothetical protein